MSSLSVFMKGNTQFEENVKYVASQRFVEEDGNPVEWEIRSIETKDDELLRKACSERVPVPGKKNQYARETDFNKYAGKLAAACTVYPDLRNAELQDSYGVKGEDNLLKAMLKPGEYNDYVAKVQEVNGFDTSMEELVEEAKN